MQKITKAVIPAAGVGARLLPETKVVPKVFLPVLSHKGRLVPAVHAIVDEALSGGIERIALVVSPDDEPLFRRYFLSGIPSRLEKALARSSMGGDVFVPAQEMGRMMEILIQEEPEGFGHAVARAEEWVGGEPFLLLLGDHLFRSNTAEPCSVQLLRIYGELGESVVGVSRLPESELANRGVIAGEPLGSPVSAYRATKLIEKPEVDVARRELRTPGLSDGLYLALFGNYILQPKIFSILRAMIEADRRFRGEIQLAHALDELGVSGGLFAYEIEGESFDMGSPECYRRAFDALVEK